MTTTQQKTIQVGHSLDPDDAFMFHALANERIETGDFRFVYELVGIETLNRRAFADNLELTAIRFMLMRIWLTSTSFVRVGMRGEHGRSLWTNGCHQATGCATGFDREDNRHSRYANLR